MTSPDLSSLLPLSAPIHPSAPSLDTRMDWKSIPAKPAVYLLTGPNDSDHNPNHPYLLATVANLRAAIQRRLTETPEDIHSKRIQYAKVCTQLHYRPVHSPFAANFHYYFAARALFPKTYPELLAFHPASWIALDPHSPFPKLRRTETLSDSQHQYAGPIRDKSSANKLIETVEDLFDLCRYHHILLQTPHGKPCAYKEMGKCPAPCDGSVPLSWYHTQITTAFHFITGASRAQFLANTESQMKAAATSLNFELAAKIKQRLTRANLIQSDPFAHLAPLEHFAFLALQPGKGKPFLEPWLIHPAAPTPIQPLDHIHKKNLPAAADSLFTACRALAQLPLHPPISESTTDQLSLLAHHLFRTNDPGLYLPLHTLHSPEPIAQALTQFFTRRNPPNPPLQQSSDTTPQPQAQEPEPPPP